MYCNRRGWRFLTICAPVLLAGCANRVSTPQKQHIAVVRFENLGQDPSADWIGRAIPLALQSELGAGPDSTIISTAALHTLDRNLGVRPISAPGISAERTQAFAAGANRIAYGNYWRRGGRLHVELWLEDTQTEKIVKIADADTAAGDALAASNELARQLTDHPAAFETRNNAALRAYAQGLEGKGIAQAASSMEEAIKADPDFGPAYRTLAELDAQRQDREGAVAVLSRALDRGSIAPAERARIQLDRANLQNDVPGKQGAFAALAKLEPANSRAWASLAEVAVTRHDYGVALDAYRKAIQLEPDNFRFLNQMAYAATYAGHFDEGMAALRKYQQMRPKDVNAVDSMGDLNFLTNRFHEAEQFYQQAQKIDPNFEQNCDLFKASMARASTGDVTGAEAIYKQYITARALAHDPGAPYKHAEWLFLTGRHQQAIDELMGFAKTAEGRNDHPGAARAYAGVAMWNLIDNNRQAAAELAQKAATFADASSAGPVLIARFLSQPSAAAAEWETRAGRFVPNPAQAGVRDQMLAWGLLLDHHFEDARAPLQRIYDVTGMASPDAITVLLAWCDIETGKLDAAAPLVELTPVPPASGINSFMPIWFPRIWDLRAKVADKTGRASEAAQDRDLLKKWSFR
ncbi:MAG TPA: hypothetical protein VHW24_04770 [Bryobacteraceae bacterium]|nr:hypothetical protein [Bryobacteraceae bacterium]